ncbi:proteasome assembly chaperone 2 [Copidosoma floridanum]|uniref:proteasome assembly chaperone 2 n=1 Tax=Copidosoma floridanum TaxID=29053 RepID=UPI0006C9555D|nr:proteasome assembly chaperone 2 [Copidosoma floridanum]
MLKVQEDLKVEGYTLAVPSVSVGNVGQLSVDLLISTLGMCRVGRIYDDCFIPLAGSDPYDESSEDICTAVDVYVSHESKIVAVQIRSPLVRRPTSFFHEVLNFVTDRKISRVIILTSSFGHEKRDKELRTVPFRYLATENVTAECGKQFDALSWITLEPKQDEFSGQSILQIHGGGFAKTMFDLLQKENVPCTVILKFCSEGDNIPDACELINYSNQWLKIIPVHDNNLCKLKFPPSWKFLFGNLPPKELY